MLLLNLLFLLPLVALVPPLEPVLADKLGRHFLLRLPMIKFAAPTAHPLHTHCTPTARPLHTHRARAPG